jgi:hypothetical protein
LGIILCLVFYFSVATAIDNSENVIHLEPKYHEKTVSKGIKSEKILFKSTNQKIKENAIWFFIIFCIILFIFYRVQKIKANIGDKNGR